MRPEREDAAGVQAEVAACGSGCVQKLTHRKETGRNSSLAAAAPGPSVLSQCPRKEHKPLLPSDPKKELGTTDIPPQLAAKWVKKLGN